MIRWLLGLFSLVWPPALFLGVTLYIWIASVGWFHIDPMILPLPGDILEQLKLGLASGIYLHHLSVTLTEALLGFVLAVVLGIGAGATISRSPLLEQTCSPLIVAFEAMPKIALAPLFITWFGYGPASKTVLAAFIAFFPVLVGTVDGLRSCDPGRLDVLRALGASQWQRFRFAELPSALPFIMAGLNVAVISVLLGSIVGEFAGAKEGLGTLILYANENLETARTFSILVLLAATGLTFHFTIVAFRRRLLFWAPSAHGPTEGVR